MRKIKLLLALCGTVAVLAVLAGCSKDDRASEGDGEVAVRFAVTDMNPTLTRAFEKGTPARVLVFRRSNAGTVADVTGTPYRTFNTTTDGSVGLNPDADGKTLSVMSGFTYDFYVLVNPPAEEISPAKWSIQHGTDLLSSSLLGKAVNRGDSDVVVNFGDLPHLGSQLRFEASVSPEFLKNNIIIETFSVNRVVWSKLPAWGTFGLGDTKITTANDYSGSFTLIPEDSEAASGSTVNGEGVVLPFPAIYTTTTNRIDIQFSIDLVDIDGVGTVNFEASAVEVPAFLPNYSYTFVLELQYDESGGYIELSLIVAPWDKAEWTAGMGGDDTTMTIIKIGSWDSITWRSGMGGDDTVKTILGVSGWSAVTWGSIMGENN